jgi:hypothetical protein
MLINDSATGAGEVPIFLLEDDVAAQMSAGQGTTSLISVAHHVRTALPRMIRLKGNEPRTAQMEWRYHNVSTKPCAGAGSRSV